MPPPSSHLRTSTNCIIHLHVLAHHSNHEVEQSDGLDEGETENGVGEELSTHAWVASDSGQEGSEDHSDTDTGTTETDGSGPHTQVLGDLDHGSGDLGVERAGGLAAHSVTGCGSEDLRSLLTLDGLERSVGADAWVDCQSLPSVWIFEEALTTGAWVRGAHTGEGTLGDKVGLEAAADNRASELG